MTWYVVCQTWIRSGYDKVYDEDRVFTISEDPAELGWDNHEDALDHGLTRAKAQYIVDVLNKYEKGLAQNK